MNSKCGEKNRNAYCAKLFAFPPRVVVIDLCKERISFATYGMNQYFHVNNFASLIFKKFVQLSIVNNC